MKKNIVLSVLLVSLFATITFAQHRRGNRDNMYMNGSYMGQGMNHMGRGYRSGRGMYGIMDQLPRGQQMKIVAIQDEYELEIRKVVRKYDAQRATLNTKYYDLRDQIEYMSPGRELTRAQAQILIQLDALNEQFYSIDQKEREEVRRITDEEYTKTKAVKIGWLNSIR